MKCRNCNSESPEGKRYCSDCGALLSADSPQARSAVEEEVRRVLGERFGDRRFVELETTERVAVRLYTWAKIFAFAAGVPLGLLVFVIGFAGIRGYMHFSALVQNGESRVASKTHDAEERASAAEKESKQAIRAIAKAKEQTEQQLRLASGLAGRVRSLSSKVSHLGQDTTRQIEEARRGVTAQVDEMRVTLKSASGDIAKQRRELANTNTLVKALYSSGKTEFFPLKAGSHRIVAVQLANRVLVFLCLEKAPIFQTLQLQWFVAVQPRNTYGLAAKNVVLFSWGDPLASLKEKPLSATYVPDPTVPDKDLIHNLSLVSGRILGDGHLLFDTRTFTKK